MSEALTFNPIQFIEEVKARPGLYDPSRPMDRGERLELWKEVGAALFPDWETYSKATAYDRVLQLQKKWRSFRDAYNRELRVRRSDNQLSVARGRVRKVYRYFKRMTFLGGFEGEITVSESSDVEEDQKPLYSMNDIEEKNERADDESQTKDHQHSDDDQDADDFQADDFRPLKAEIPSKTRQKSAKKAKAKRKRSSSSNFKAAEEYEMPMPLFSSTDVTESENDSDKLFLMSFAPEMRQLPMHLKMWARTQIANVMQEAVTSYCNNTLPTPPNIGVKKRKMRNSDDFSD